MLHPSSVVRDPTGPSSLPKINGSVRDVSALYHEATAVHVPEFRRERGRFLTCPGKPEAIALFALPWVAVFLLWWYKKI